jgi:glycosyltransferase involved in cell wall biosynthesis
VKEEPLADDIAQVNTFVRNVHICRRRRRLTDALALTPWQIKSRHRLKNIRLPNSYDIVSLEGHYVYPILGNPTLQAPTRILRLQNNESVYFKELARSVRNPWKKIYFFAESGKFLLMESKLRKQVKNMMFISKDEFEESVSRYPEMNSILLPPALPTNDFRKAPLTSRNVLLLGSLFMTNNQEAVRWYIQNVHPLLSGLDGYHLIVAGNSRGEELSWLNRLADNNDNIEVVDTPPQTEPLYERSSAFVNPMLHGAGVKLKTIEAIQNGLPVVSTSVGNQGTGLEHERDILVTDDPRLFAEYVERLLLSGGGRTMVNTAQQTLRKTYNQKEALRDYLIPLVGRDN